MSSYVTVALCEDEPDLIGETFAVYLRRPGAKPEVLVPGSKVPAERKPNAVGRTVAALLNLDFHPYRYAAYACIGGTWVAWDMSLCGPHSVRECVTCSRDDSVYRDPRAGRTFVIDLRRTRERAA